MSSDRSSHRRVPVAIGRRAYEVIVGPGARDEVREVIASKVTGAVRAAVVTQAGIPFEVDAGIPVDHFTIPDGESAKTMATVESLCRSFARAGLHRGDVVVAVGGGVVTDVAGFAAATFHRGVALVNVATSLLGQVDAAIGGKTGVNIPEGKNLIGAFWQPRAVICDTDALATLPEREWACGRGEMAKYAFLRTPSSGSPDASLLDMPIEQQVATCAAIKADVVSADEREAGTRMILNYGHTLAHALEAAAFAGGGNGGTDRALRHGEAVAVGLVFAAKLARNLGRIDDARVELHREIVARFGLSEAIPVLRPGVGDDDLLEFMARDKKANGGLTFVLDGPGGVEPVFEVDPDAVLATLADMPRTGDSSLDVGMDGVLRTGGSDDR
ncbi:MAG: 3-dehydroquinate synthase [Actinomycetota bacterium]|nr:3-dehydroquinate synthase [Actinomycetota bacterium]